MMKNYKIFYEYYPFNVEFLTPKFEEIEADCLEDAFSKLEESKGKENIEVFKSSARKYYNEY